LCFSTMMCILAFLNCVAPEPIQIALDLVDAFVGAGAELDQGIVVVDHGQLIVLCDDEVGSLTYGYADTDSATVRVDLMKSHQLFSSSAMRASATTRARLAAST